MKNYCKGFMISFEVKSLFTNIPLEETIEIALSKLFKDKNSRVESLKRFHAFKNSNPRITLLL